MAKMEEDILARQQGDFFSTGTDPSLFPVLNSRPELFADLLWIWEGFMCLSVSRQYGMSAPQPISIVAINAYCQYRDIVDPDEREDFLHHVQKLDSVFMKDFKAKNPTPQSGGKPQRLGSL